MNHSLQVKNKSKLLCRCIKSTQKRMLYRLKSFFTNGIKNALDFGNSSKIQKYERTHFATFFLKTVLMIVPAIVLGHYIDEYMDHLHKHRKLGEKAMTYILAQTMLSIIVVYILYRMFRHYADEFQTTSAGLFFSALFWGFQTKYIDRIKAEMKLTF